MAPALVVREPIGVIGAVVPFNGPIMSAAAKIAPVLASGCPIVFKPAPETPLDAFVLAEAAEAAGIPPGVVNIVPGDADVGAALVAHDGVDRVVFTGSTTAGRADLRRVRRLDQAPDARARRQGRRGPARRRADRGIARVNPADVVLQQRPGVHRAEPGARAPRIGTTRWSTPRSRRRGR